MANKDFSILQENSSGVFVPRTVSIAGQETGLGFSAAGVLVGDYVNANIVVVMAADHDIATGGATKLNLDTVSFAGVTGLTFSPGSARVTPVWGAGAADNALWWVCAQVTPTNGVVGNKITLEVRTGGGANLIMKHFLSGVDETVQISGLLQLTSGVYVEAYVTHDKGSNMNFNHLTGLTKLSLNRLS